MHTQLPPNKTRLSLGDGDVVDVQLMRWGPACSHVEALSDQHPCAGQRAVGPICRSTACQFWAARPSTCEGVRSHAGMHRCALTNNRPGCRCTNWAGGGTRARGPRLPSHTHTPALPLVDWCRVSSDVLIVSLLDGHVVALDQNTGRVVWTFDSGAPLVSAKQSFSSSQGLNVFPGTDGGLYAYHGLTHLNPGLEVRQQLSCCRPQQGTVLWTVT